MAYEIKVGDSLRGGDKIVNVGRVLKREMETGMFSVYSVSTGAWDLTTGRMVGKTIEVTFHAADYVTVEV